MNTQRRLHDLRAKEALELNTTVNKAFEKYILDRHYEGVKVTRVIEKDIGYRTEFTVEFEHNTANVLHTASVTFGNTVH